MHGRTAPESGYPPGRRLFKPLFGLLLAALGIFLATNPQPALTADSPQQVQASSQKVYVLRLEDEIISPVTAEYIRKGVETAEEVGASAVVIELDTPGGLLNSTHTITKTILNAGVPVVVYVSPAGARAGSAGVFITMAAHVAAMNPTSHIGAAHPVDTGGSWPPGNPPEPAPGPISPGTGPEAPAKPTVEDAQQVMSEKILNDTVAAIRTLAASRGRNVDWAARAVTESASITAEEALANNVVDVLAPNLDKLLAQIDGRSVDLRGSQHTIAVSNPAIIRYEFSVRQQILSFLTHPLLAYVLLMVGFYGLLFEVTHPGFGLPGIAGIVCLILALIGLQALSINFAGLGLMIVGMVLFVIEVFTPTFGMLFAGGWVCLVLGTLLLYQTQEPFLLQVVPYATTIALFVGALTAFILWRVVKVYRRKPEGPLEKLVDKLGVVLVPLGPSDRGKVRVYGEIWDAEAEEPLEKDADIRVTAILDKDRRILRVTRHIKAGTPKKVSS